MRLVANGWNVIREPLKGNQRFNGSASVLLWSLQENCEGQATCGCASNLGFLLPQAPRLGNGLRSQPDAQLYDPHNTRVWPSLSRCSPFIHSEAIPLLIFAQGAAGQRAGRVRRTRSQASASARRRPRRRTRSLGLR